MTIRDLHPLAAQIRTRINERTYRVFYHADWSGWGLHWRLAITGHGHWCDGSDGRGNPFHAGSFRTEGEAEQAGRLWVETGDTRGVAIQEVWAA